MSFLSDAMSTAMPPVRDVIVARIRCWWTPWPSWTRLNRSSRMYGMSRPAASSSSACVDGPNASRSASRISFSSSAMQVEGDGRVARRDEVVDQPDGGLAGLDADLLLAVLEDHVVPAVLAGAAGLAVADVGAGEVLELERDVLRHVPDPGAVAEARDEPAAPAEGAGVVLERRQHLDQRVDEARDLVARELLEHAEVDDLADDRLARPVVGAAQDPGLEDPQRRARGAGRRSRRPCAGWPACAPSPVGRRSRPCSGSRVRLRHRASSRPRAGFPSVRAAAQASARRSSPRRHASGQLEAISPPWIAWSVGAATRTRRRRSNR